MKSEMFRELNGRFNLNEDGETQSTQCSQRKIKKKLTKIYDQILLSLKQSIKPFRVEDRTSSYCRHRLRLSVQ